MIGIIGFIFGFYIHKLNIIQEHGFWCQNGMKSNENSIEYLAIYLFISLLLMLYFRLFLLPKLLK